MDFEIYHYVSLCLVREELGYFACKVVQDHVCDIEAGLRVLDLVVDPVRVVFLYIRGHQLSEPLLSVQISSLFLSLMQWRRNHLLAHLVLGLWGCLWQRSKVGASSHL